MHRRIASTRSAAASTPARITGHNADGCAIPEPGSAQREQRYVYGMQEGCLSESIWDGTSLLSQRLSDGFGQIVAEISPTTLSNTSICTRSSYNARGQLTQQGIDGMAPTVYDYDSMGHVCRQTLLLDADAPDDASKNRIITHSIAAVEEADGMIYQVSTESRSTAAGNTLSRSEQTLLSDSAELESKRISIDERGNSTTSLTEYGIGSMRVRKNIIPTSAITAESVVIDGFVRSQKDTAGITTTAMRAYTASGMVLTQTDGRGNTTTTVTDIAGRTTSVTDAAGNVTTTAYDTAHDLPALITDAMGNTSCYKYDIRGRKVAEWGTAIQSPRGLVGGLDKPRSGFAPQGRAGNGVPASQPIATRPLAIRKDGTWYAYGWDLTKNICEVFGPVGYIRTTYTYTPYGEVTATGDVTQPIQWSSEFNESELVLVYYNYRHYNPVDDRWIGRDRIGEKASINSFSYVENFPYGRLDELGLSSSPVIGQRQPSFQQPPVDNSQECQCCQKYIQSEKDKHASSIKQIKDKGCSLHISCSKNYRNIADHQAINKDSYITFDCKSLSTAKRVNAMRHELQHAFDSCSGDMGAGCFDSICSEIKAYRNAEYPSRKKNDKLKEELRARVKPSAKAYCSNHKDSANFEKEYDKKFDEIYNKCID